MSRTTEKIALIHFLPLEQYPPVMNFINSWLSSAYASKFSMQVYTTKCTIPGIGYFKADSGHMAIKRFGPGVHKTGFIRRLLHYIIYYTRTLAALIITRPDKVFYYDSLSSFPAYCYKVFIRRSCSLFIHYHEYMSPEEYARGMVLLKWFHNLEKKIYRSADWVSHTNIDRMQLFESDLRGVHIANKHTLPNYPPHCWAVRKENPIQFPVRFVQVGTLGLDTMYVKEFAAWIVSQKGRATWDIYSIVADNEAMDYLQSLQSNDINYKGKVNYYELPAVLSVYDVGVILYKGHIPNFIYNAPNKLFEYYMCGLDVWFPAQMVTAGKYATNGTFPRILPVIFEQLPSYSLQELVDRSKYTYRQDAYTAENAFEEIFSLLAKKNNKGNHTT